MKKNLTLLALITIMPLLISRVWTCDEIKGGEENLKTNHSARKSSHHRCGCFSIFNKKPQTRQHRVETEATITTPIPSNFPFNCPNNAQGSSSKTVQLEENNFETTSHKDYDNEASEKDELAVALFEQSEENNAETTSQKKFDHEILVSGKTIKRKTVLNKNSLTKKNNTNKKNRKNLTSPSIGSPRIIRDETPTDPTSTSGSKNIIIN